MATLLASAARTASGTAAITFSKPITYDVFGAVFLLDVTVAATDAGDTLDVYLQHSVDGSAWDDFVHFTQVLGNGGAKQYHAQWSAFALPDSEQHALADAALAAGVLHGPVGSSWRAKWVVVDDGADNASFTFSVSAELHRRA